MSKQDNCEMWCTACGYRVQKGEYTDLICCPKCNSTGTPCAPENDVSIEINWHELRILGIWASNWAGEHCKDQPDSIRTLSGILGRLHRQFPNKASLTMGGDVASLRKMLNERNGSVMEFAGELAESKPLMPVVVGPGAVGFVQESED